MVFYRFRVLSLSLFISAVWAARDPSVCDIQTTSCGPIPPGLPKNFQMKAGLVINASQTLEWEEFYFDNTNLKGKYMYLSEGIEHHYIFDYDAEQIIKYDKLHPGAKSERNPLSDVCTAENMDSSKWVRIFGYRDGMFQTKHSKMYNAYEVLRYGGEYPYAYNGTHTHVARGFSANKFIGCIYDSFVDVTAEITYHFSNEYFMPAGGTPEYLVDGVQNGMFLSIPVSASFKGVSKPQNKDEKKSFEELISISWFKGEPEFDYDTFKIPPWMYCDRYRGTKPLPQMPRAFSTRMEMTIFSQDMFGKMTAAEMVFYYQIYYDMEQGIARRDFTPLREEDTDIYSQFGNYGPVKEIYDFNTGVTYIINKNSGRCYERAINFGDFFETSKEQMYIKMAAPEEFFLMEAEKQEYKGKYFVRDIETEAWAGKSVYEMTNDTYVSEIYISTAGWHEEADEKTEYGVPIRHTVITDKMEEGEYIQTVVETNFFKFKIGSPPLMAFDLQGCLENIDHTYLVITLSVAPKDEDIVNRNRWRFNQVAQSYIAEVSEIGSPLRIHRVRLMRVSGLYFFTFAVAEKTSKKTKTTELGISGAEAIQNLRLYVENGKFAINFKFPGMTEGITVTGTGLYSLPEKNKAPNVEFLPPQFRPVEKLSHTVYFDDNTKEKVKKGMSAGGLAGLAIAMLLIGVAIGIAVMYLYIRRYSNDSLGRSFPMKG